MRADITINIYKKNPGCVVEIIRYEKGRGSGIHHTELTPQEAFKEISTNGIGALGITNQMKGGDNIFVSTKYSSIERELKEKDCRF